MMSLGRSFVCLCFFSLPFFIGFTPFFSRFISLFLFTATLYFLHVGYCITTLRLSRRHSIFRSRQLRCLTATALVESQKGGSPACGDERSLSSTYIGLDSFVLNSQTPSPLCISFLCKYSLPPHSHISLFLCERASLSSVCVIHSSWFVHLSLHQLQHIPLKLSSRMYCPSLFVYFIHHRLDYPIARAALPWL